MEFRVLGPLEVLANGQTLELGGQKQRVLLAVLLLEANRVVSRERLTDAIWEDEPPETARKALQVYVSQLRKVLGAERLQTRSPGYVLSLDPDELDLARCRRLREEGKPAEALALWRGSPLGEFAHLRFAQAETARLDELRLACLEERLDQDLRRGLSSELVGELEALVYEHPLREGLRGRLMLALYRAGRQAEALEAYQDARRRLVDEIGLEPGQSLRGLHLAILNQDPALDFQPDDDDDGSAALEVEPVARDTRKSVTVVSVVTSTSSPDGGHLDPEALRNVTERAFDEIERAITRYGGIVEAVAGGTLTAVFGLPTVHEDDALRAVRAAADARAVLATFSAAPASDRPLEFSFRIGISTGEVVTGTATGVRARTTGEPLTRASSLAQRAGSGEILCDGESRKLLRDAVLAEVAEGSWRLVSIGGAGSGQARRLHSPMVGRARHVHRLHDAFEQAVSDTSCQSFTVLGQAGVGKSRLVQEFLDGVRGRALVGHGRCLPYGEGITYWPLLEAVKDLIGLDDADSPRKALAKLTRTFGPGEQSRLLARQVAEMIGLAEAEGGAEERFVAVRTLLETLGQRTPLILVFDDVHWGEETFLDLVEHVAEETRNAPLLLVCLARPELYELRPGWGGGKLNATVVLLEPLEDRESAELIQNLLGGTAPAAEVATRISRAAEGNPLFVEEMLSMLIDEGLLVRADEGWVATGDVATIRMPATIQSLLAARLDRLSPADRSAIERAAVAGMVFQEGAIVELSPGHERPAVAGALASLVRKELIRPDRASLGESTYRFRHLLIRDAAYESVPKEVRAGLHERFGRWLERSTAERATEYEEVVGYHLEQAYWCRSELTSPDEEARSLARLAAERLGSAGRRAFLRSDAPAGVNLISRAVALLPAADPLRVELVPNVRVVQATGIDMGWADRVLTDAVEAAATSGDRLLAAHALVQRGLLRLFTEHEVTPEELIQSALRSRAVFAEVGDELGVARTWRLEGQAHYLGRRAGLCVDASERALLHARRAQDSFEQREIVEWLVIALLLGPSPAASAELRCESLLEETGDQALTQALVLSAQATLTAMQDRLAQAADLQARSRAIMRASGTSIWIASFWWGFISIWAGDPVAAEQELRPAYEALKATGSKSHFSSLAHALSTAVYARGNYEEAERLTRECEQASRPNDVHSQILWRSIRAKTLSQRGRHDQAEQLAREAIGFASSSDFLPAHADAAMDLAEVLELAGNPVEAAEAAQEARRLYELKGNVLAASRLATPHGSVDPGKMRRTFPG